MKDALKGSNKWQESFRKKHNILLTTQSSESKDVPKATVNKWKGKLPKLIQGYDPKDVYNMDETGLFLDPPMTKLYFIKERNAVVVRKLSCS